MTEEQRNANELKKYKVADCFMHFVFFEFVCVSLFFRHG